MSSARKPVIVRKLTRDWCAGYANAEFSSETSEPGPLKPTLPNLELLDISGKLIHLPWNGIKWVCYVRELEPAGGYERDNPERLLRRRFSSKPRTPGLWLRLTLSDGDELEGLAANDRSLLDMTGLFLTPPDTRSNTQRIFVPRDAIRELTVLAVILPTRPAPTLSSSERVKASMQPELFDQEPQGG